MKFINFQKSNQTTSRLIYGCMRIAGNNTSEDKQKGKKAIATAIEAGYNHFDHADIYGQGECERLFGETIKELSVSDPSLRQKLIFTSKAGIRSANEPSDNSPGRYDFSKEYLIKSVEASLKRLNTDYLDIFLLHRPDYLMNADEVAETFEQLKVTGKVNHFGVSNFTTSQFELLNNVLTVPLVVNQIEVNIHNISAFENGTLDQCQQHKISPMAWCPLGGVVYPAWGNSFSKETQERINLEIQLQAEKYQASAEHIILAWLLKHPANILPIIGSTTPERIVNATKSLSIDYCREDWYRLLEARNGYPVP